MSRSLRRGRRALLATLALTVLAPAAAAAAPEPAADAAAVDAAEAAAGWLAAQLTDDPAVPGPYGADVGQTIDAVLAFDAAGVGADLSRDATAWIASQAASYVSATDDDGTEHWYSGTLGKLLLLSATRPELAPDAIGEIDAVTRLEALECPADGAEHCEPWEVGSFKGEGPWAYHSTTYQAYAVLGLGAADVTPSEAAVTYLASQACPDGGFQDETRAPDGDCAADVDTTSLAVQALHAVGRGDLAAASVDWLRTQQGADGGFGGSGPTAAANANSTAMAVQGLLAAGDEAAASAGRSYLVSLQVPCDEAEGGAIRYATAEGADPGGGSAWATAQAIPALVGRTLDDINGADARDDVPAPCPATTPVEEEPEAPDEDATEAPDEGDRDGGEAGADVDAEAPREGTEAAPGELPRTGAVALWPVAAAGAALLAGGATIVRRSSRTRS